NDSTGRGEGHISYFVKPIAALPSGTRIENEARIIFDFNEPIDTPVVVNTIDADRPSSSVDALPATVDTTEFDVSWSGQDGANGSGVGRYDIYVSINGGPREAWLQNTTETTATYTGRNRHTYAFYSVATDHVGNRELKLPADEAVVEIGLTNHPPTDIALTPDSVPENSPGGTLIGLLTTEDPDPDETLTYTLLDDAGGRFEIDGDQLVVAAGADLDFETHASHEITVRSADGDGETVDKTLTVSVTDVHDDPAGFLVSAISGDVTEAGGTATFTIALTRPPTVDVTVQFVSSDTTEGTVSPSSITFTAAEGDWQTARTITVTGVDDQIDDDDVAFSIIGTATTTDPEYNGIHPAPVSVMNRDDNDTAGIEVSAISSDVTEDGQTVATFTVWLTSEPTGTVEIGISSSDPSEGTVSPAALTFDAANWHEPQTVTVTGVDDWLDDGDVWFQIITAAAVSPDAKYSGRNAADLTLKNVDDDTAGFTLDKTQVTVGEDGTTDAFTVVLDAQPVTDVVLDISSSNAAEATVDRPRLTFTPADWNLPQTVTITAVDDAAVDGAVASTVT
ncbi:MAG TPA: cadherin repeat domain-containing protein, partial [Candidatus Anammoximicrobium sp.]|nr:cadherin repeat domain-containing protein [Candidatus Anammoximicrobium sp.]